LLIKPAPDVRSSEITDRGTYVNRRTFIRAVAGGAAGVATAAIAGQRFLSAATPAPHGRKLQNVVKSRFSTDEKLNTWEQITTFNNYYEFGSDKDQPSQYAH